MTEAGAERSDASGGDISAAKKSGERTGLWLSALRVSHFRSHHAAQLTLDQRPVAIFGPNGAGKTNLIEAVSLLSPGRGLRRAAADDIARQPEALGWKVAAELTGAGHGHEIETWADPGEARRVRIDGKTAPQAALGRVVRMLWLVPAMDRIWTEGADGRRRFLDRMTLSFEPAHAEAVLSYEKAMRERNRLLRDGANDPRWYAALEAQMAASGARIARNRATTLVRVAAAGATGEGTFPVADLAIVGPEGTAETQEAPVLSEALAQGRRADMAAGRTLIGPHRADLEAIYSTKGIAARQCSTGEQKALLISVVLANARALAAETGCAPILLLDEVAAHLDSNRRAALYDEICALGVQAWMTGTGPELFEALGDRAQRFEVREEGGRSEIRKGNDT